MREVRDKDYQECLPSDIYRRHYANWKQRMLERIDSIAGALRESNLSTVMTQFELSPRDITLLVKLHYFTDAEIDEFNLGSLMQMEVI